MTILDRAAARRAAALDRLDARSQFDLGQFFTPAAVARIMASMPCLPEGGVLRVLDPGAGTGVLSAAVVERVRRERPDLQVRVTAVEVDPCLRPALAETLEDCRRAGAQTTLVEGSFVNWALHTQERFDLVVQNPPYRKLRSGFSPDRELRSAGVVVPNIYAGFMALGARVLTQGGQQVSITPRSWMNGAYFARFRRSFLDIVGIDAIHTFRSRAEVFADLGCFRRLSSSVPREAGRRGRSGCPPPSITGMSP